MVYFWVTSQQKNALAVSDRVATGIKLALDRAGIDMPFPHSVVLFHDQTGEREENRKEALPAPGRAVTARNSRNGVVSSHTDREVRP